MNNSDMQVITMCRETNCKPHKNDWRTEDF